MVERGVLDAPGGPGRNTGKWDVVGAVPYGEGRTWWNGGRGINLIHEMEETDDEKDSDPAVGAGEF